MKKQHTSVKPKEFYMKKALLQARSALKKDEVPIGAVVVGSDGKVLARAYNQVELQNCQSSHAEVLAIKRACKKIGDWRLNGCSLYVTLEPCLMCLGLIKLSRLDHVVFGAKSPIFGACFLDACSDKSFVKINAKNLKVEGGVCVEECANLLQEFFGNKRKKKGE